MLEDRLWRCWKRKTSQIAATTFFDPLNHLLDTLDCQLRRAQSASRSKPSPKAVAGRRKSAEAVDESETGSANFFGPVRVTFSPAPKHEARITPQMHLRLPSIDPGVRAFLWALFLALYIWGFLLAIGIDKGTSTVIGLLSFGGIFLVVRIFGGDEEL